MRQIKLVPAGVQASQKDSIAATHGAFAYSSTMALHIFNLKDCTLTRMFAAHERAITAICWSPEDPNLIGSCSVSGRIFIWDLEKEEELHGAKFNDAISMMDWAPRIGGGKIALALENGEVHLWDYLQGDAKSSSKIVSLGKGLCKVLRWHPCGSGGLLIGSGDGSIHVWQQSTSKKTTIVGKSKTSKDAVTDAQWDPLSTDYFLVSWSNGDFSLYDVNTQREVYTFEKQAQGIRSMAWAKSQPGNFLTCTDKVGLLKLWNVSQKTPLSQIKVGTSGVNCIKAIPNEPNQFVLSFKNSAVGVVDIAHRSMRFQSSPGHSETIFDCVFHPDDPDLLATASYDGHVKIWRISTCMSERDMNAGDDALLYGLSFGPGAAKLCAVSSAGFLYVWNAETGTQLLRQQIHQGHAYRVEWNLYCQREGVGDILTGGADGYACLTDSSTGHVVRKAHHPAAVIGVAWNAFHEGIMATGCQDGNVRIFNVLDGHTGDLQPQAILKGHEARVFNIAFNPICPGLIASGSDDQTIRVWHWNRGGGELEVRRLLGHTAYVRGLLWHSELPGILFSGSWDATIRIWDVAQARCIHVCHEHHADVYGLTLHPARPFFLVSSSRDTTLRFWVFEDLIRPLLTQAVVRPERLAELLGAGPEEAMSYITAPPGSVMVPPMKLYGQASRRLVAELQALTMEKKSLQVYEKIVSFFMYRTGIQDMWGLLAVLRGEPVMASAAKRTIFHERELIACQKSKALELASARAQIGVAVKKEERMLQAAQIMLRIGDLRSYCRFTAQAGQWERAICVAPAVSRQFWQELCAEYIDQLSASADIDEVAPFLIVSGQAEKLSNMFIDRADLDSAFVVAKADHDGLLPVRETSTAAPEPLAAGSLAQRSRLEDVAQVLAKKYALEGESVQACMCFLAVSSGSRAVHALSRSHEVVLAYVVADLLGLSRDPIVLKLLANCAERDQRWDVAADIWRLHPKGPELHIPLLAARAQDKVAAQAWTSYTQQQHQDMHQQSQASGNRAGIVLHSVCLGDRAQAAQVGVDGLYALFGNPGGWRVNEARDLLDPLEALPLQDMSVKDIAGILSCAAYVGLVEAAQLGYHELMFPLAQTLRNIIQHQNLAFPVASQEITFYEAASVSHRDSGAALRQFSSLLQDPNTPPHLRPACEQQIAAIQQRTPGDDWLPQDGPGLGKMAGNHLPTCYKRHAKTSVLTNQLIKGAAFPLEDQKSHISVSDALAWTRVNAFSPLNTGFKIYPV